MSQSVEDPVYRVRIHYICIFSRSLDLCQLMFEYPRVPSTGVVVNDHLFLHVQPSSAFLKRCAHLYKCERSVNLILFP